ncbi:hypothetical protein D3C71_1926310 [compost metagenome]
MLQSLRNDILNQFTLKVQIKRSVFNPGNGQEILHQMDQPNRVIVNIGIQAPFLLLIQNLGIADENACIAGNTSQGSPQVMGNTAQQVCPQLLLLNLHGAFLLLLIQPCFLQG